MNDLNKIIQAKIPGADSGIRVCRSFCDICAPGPHCGVDAYVKDGKIIKVEGTKGHPSGGGFLCTRGAANRQYIYRSDRLMTPLIRTGPKGSGRFREASWDEAYGMVSEKLLAVRAESGAESVAFYSGYSKWYRPFLQRFAYAFGSPNYGTESSSCFTASVMAWKLNAGQFKMRPDLGRAGLYLGWALCGYGSMYRMPAGVARARERGMKVIIIDVRQTPMTQKHCDLFLQIKPGTDGALALCFGKLLIERGLVDEDFVRVHVHGFEEYRAYVQDFGVERVSGITGIPAEQILRAVDMMQENAPVAIHESGAPIIHHKNGMQAYRAVTALCALMGTYMAPGGQWPDRNSYAHSMADFVTMEEEFSEELRPRNARAMVGQARFPLWAELVGQMQAVDLGRQIRDKTPYPIRALLAHGLNFRTFNDSPGLQKALEELDFFVDVDLFMTDTAKYADVILPACSSFEREEFKVFGPDKVCWYEPVIPPLGQAKADTTILRELARAMALEDDWLKKPYGDCVAHMIRNLPVSLEELRARPGEPMTVAGGKGPAAPEFATPTGKFELWSTVLEKYGQFSPLPVYEEPLDGADPAVYPFVLCSGGRLAHALHSRLHDVPWLRSLRPLAMAELNAEDGAALGLEEGGDMELFTAHGVIRLKAHLSHGVQKGVVMMYHGYREADVNSLIPPDHNDPYSGFPGYNSLRCGVRKAEAL